LFAIAGYYGLQFNSHNQYVDLLAQTGVLGLLAFLWFVAEMAWLGWSLRNRVPDGFARGYLYGALGGLGASLFAGMLGDWVLPFVYNVGFMGFRSSMFFWLFLGGLLALSRMSPSESKRAGREPQSLVFPPR
jgi:O-antigen ligase